MSYTPNISWETEVHNVYPVNYDPNNPGSFLHEYTCDVPTQNLNDFGAGQLSVGYYLVDYLGSVYEIKEIGVDGVIEKIRVYDINEGRDSNETINAPYEGMIGFICELTGGGLGLSVIQTSRLHSSARDVINYIDNFIIWKRNISHNDLIDITYNDHHSVGAGINWDINNNIAHDPASVHELGGALEINHDLLKGFVSNEHIDWTVSQTDNIHSDNYINTQLSQEQVEDFAFNRSLINGTQTLITVTYNDTGNALNFEVNNNLSQYDNSISGFISNITNESFIDLIDTPDSYIADKWVKVNAAANAIEFIDEPKSIPEINQINHEFDGDFIYHNGIKWVKAQADIADNCATHFAVKIDLDNFYLYQSGLIISDTLTDEDGLALVAGDYYFLSQTTPGKVSSVKPETGNVQSVLIEHAGKASIAIEEPYELVDVGGDSGIDSVLSSASFDPATGEVTFERTDGLANIVVNLDGRYLQTETNPGGLDGALQYNNNGVFGGTGLIWNDSTNTFGWNITAEANTFLKINTNGTYASSDNVFMDFGVDDGAGGHNTNFKFSQEDRHSTLYLNSNNNPSYIIPSGSLIISPSYTDQEISIGGSIKLGDHLYIIGRTTYPSSLYADGGELIHLQNHASDPDDLYYYNGSNWVSLTADTNTDTSYPPGGSDSQIQYNNNGNFGGSTFNYDDSLDRFGFYCTPLSNSLVTIQNPGSLRYTDTFSYFKVWDGWNDLVTIDSKSSGTVSMYISDEIKYNGPFFIKGSPNILDNTFVSNNLLYNVGSINLANHLSVYSKKIYNSLSTGADSLKRFFSLHNNISPGNTLTLLQEDGSNLYFDQGGVASFIIYVNCFEYGTPNYSVFKIEGALTASGVNFGFLGTPSITTIGESVVGDFSPDIVANATDKYLEVKVTNNTSNNGIISANVELNLLH